jgi:hypothetical protein
MRHAILSTFAAALCLAASGLHAADGKQSDAQHEQQGRMKACNADAKTKGLKGDDRKAFMGECLKKKA